MRFSALIAIALASTAASATAATVEFNGTFTENLNPLYLDVGTPFTGTIDIGNGVFAKDSTDDFYVLGAIFHISFNLNNGQKWSLGNITSRFFYTPAQDKLSLVQQASSYGMGYLFLDMPKGFVSIDANGAPVPFTKEMFEGLTVRLTAQAPALNGGIYGTGLATFGSAVPEPASWALMIGGIGLAGGMIRRQRARAVTFA